jgi:hypothetical protein
MEELAVQLHRLPLQIDLPALRTGARLWACPRTSRLQRELEDHPRSPTRRPLRLNDGLGRWTGGTRPSPSRGLPGRTVRRRVRAPPSGSRQPDPNADLHRVLPPRRGDRDRAISRTELRRVLEEVREGLRARRSHPRGRTGAGATTRAPQKETSLAGVGRVQPIHRYPTPGSVRISRGAAASSPSLRRSERT